MPENFVTLFNSAFLPQGLALHSSMQTCIKDYKLWILCVDENTFEILNNLSLPNVNLLRLSELETAELKNLKRTRKTNEYCWTLTPFAPKFVFNNDSSIDRVTYIDADLWFRKNPKLIFKEFEHSGKNVLITDHAYSPEYDQSDVSGQFCVQFIIFEREGGECVRKWWERKCVEWCYDRVENGKFGDQKYLDAWPDVFSDKVHVLQQKELALAPWNALRFPYGNSVFYHFHGLKIISENGVHTGPYRLPLALKRNVYRKYVYELKNKINILKTHGEKLSFTNNKISFVKRLYIKFRTIYYLYHQCIPSSTINIKTEKTLTRRVYEAKNNLIFFNKANENDVIINASNIFGYGAVQLVSNLLEELQYKHRSVIVIVPDTGVLAKFQSKHSRVFKYKRYFSSKISRSYECLLYYKFCNAKIMYTLGDIPVSFPQKQILLMHTPNLLKSKLKELRWSNAKYYASRFIFNINKSYIDRLIVQSEYIKDEILRSYSLKARIDVIRQPPPFILKDKKDLKKIFNKSSLKLFYPAINYPHKNHQIFKGLNNSNKEYSLEIILTLDINSELQNIDYISLVGKLKLSDVYRYYAHTDALIFPSIKETLGFPLIECIFTGKPIICSDLPYSRAIFGNHPDIIYFNPHCVDSLEEKIDLLYLKLSKGWYPNWDNLKPKFPKNWKVVADMFYNATK